MNKRPLFAISIFFICGIILIKLIPLEFYYPLGFLVFFIGTLIFILSSFIFSKYQKISNIFLFLSITFFASLLYLNANIYSNNHISHFLNEGSKKTDIVGIIKSPALARRPYFGKINSTYLFEIEKIKDKNTWLGVNGLAQIRIQTEKPLNYADRLLVKGSIKKSRDYLKQQNVSAIINTKETNIIFLSHNYKSNPILRFIYFIRKKSKTQVLEKMPLESGAFLRAILLGDRSELPKDIQTSFKHSGTMHVLAISVLHVGFIAFIIFYLLKVIRIKREGCYIFTVIFLMVFTLFTLARPSVVRSVIMACVLLIGMLLGKRTDVYNSLGAAALFILIKNPKDLFNIGFQLSFLAVLSIVYIAPKFIRLIKEDVNFYIKRWVYMPLAVSLSACIGTFPLILYYFNIITPIAIISNLFIIPLLFILLIGGGMFLLLSWVPFLGAFLAFVTNLLAQVIFYLAGFFGSLKFGHFYLG